MEDDDIRGRVESDFYFGFSSCKIPFYHALPS